MKPKIFISSVSSELRTARQKVADAIRHLGFEPVWQEEFPTDAGKIRAVLEEKIDQCEGLIQLVGAGYGFEPREEITDFSPFDRISYTQFEYLYATKKGLKTWLIAVGDGVQRDTPVDRLDLPPTSDYPDPEAYQKTRFELQERYKEEVLGGDDLSHAVQDNEELARVSGRIPPAFQDLAEAYRRKLKLIVGGIAAILVLLVVVLAVTLRTSGQTETLVKESAEIKSTTEAIATDTDEILEVSGEIGKATVEIATDTDELLATSSRIGETTEQTASDVQNLQQQVEELNTQAVKEAEASFVYLDTLIDEAFLWGRLEPSYRVNLAATNAALAIGQNPQVLKSSLRSNERLSISNEPARLKILAARQAIDMDAVGLRETAQKLADWELKLLKGVDDEKSRTDSLMRFLEYREMEIVALLIQGADKARELEDFARETAASISPEDSALAYLVAKVILANVLLQVSEEPDEALDLLAETHEELSGLGEDQTDRRIELTLLHCTMSMAGYYDKEERYREVIPHGIESLSLSQELLGFGHPMTIRAKALLGRAVFEVDFLHDEEVDGYDSDSLLKEARNSAHDYYGKDHVEFARLQYLFVFRCNHVERPISPGRFRKKENIESLVSYFETIQKYLGDHWITVELLEDIMENQYFANRHSDSAETCNRVVSILRAYGKYETRQCADALRNKASNYRSIGRLDETTAAHQEAIDVARKIDEDDASAYFAGHLKTYAEALLEFHEKDSDVSLNTVSELAEEMIEVSKKPGDRANNVRSEGEQLLAKVEMAAENIEEAYSHSSSAVEYLMKDRKFHLEKYDYSARKIVEFFYETSTQLHSHEDTIRTLEKLSKDAGFDQVAWKSWITGLKLGD